MAVGKRRESNHPEGGHLDADQNPATDVNLTTGSTTTDDSSDNEESTDATNAFTTAASSVGAQGQWHTTGYGVYYWQGPGNPDGGPIAGDGRATEESLHPNAGERNDGGTTTWEHMHANACPLATNNEAATRRTGEAWPQSALAIDDWRKAMGQRRGFMIDLKRVSTAHETRQRRPNHDAGRQ